MLSLMPRTVHVIDCFDFLSFHMCQQLNRTGDNNCRHNALSVLKLNVLLNFIYGTIVQ